METDNKQREFLEILQQHSGILYKVCRMYGNTVEDRQDLFQEIAAQIWKSFSTFREESKITTWIYRIALNTAISDYRKQQRRINYTALQDVSVVKDLQDNEKSEKLKQMYDAIAKLTDVEKALVMLYIDEKTYEEMEEILGMTQGNMRVKINRIKEKLRKNVSEQ